MRMIILILIFINVVFLYWARENNFNEVHLEDPKTIPGYAPIKLLSELSTNQAEGNKSSSIEQESHEEFVAKKNIIEKCFSLGPFDTKINGDQAYEFLLGAGVQAKQRTVKERQPKSYWVYLPPYGSLAEAEEATVFLKKNRISEYYIWLEPPLEYAVSLGLFTSLNTARAKVTQAKKLDLNPEMEVRFNEFTEYWVDIKHNQHDPQPESLEEMLRKNDRLLILETKCL